MKDTKRRVEFFSFYDHTGIEAHLARMAERGWLLDSIGRGAWRYRRIEPKTLTFSVCYYPKASIYDPGPDEDQETFYDFCAHTGWTLAGASAQMQVFYNEQPDPVPIDTDPVLEMDAIHQSAKKSFLPSQIALAVVGLMNAGMALWRLADDPIQFLATPASLFLLVCWPVLLLLLGVDLGTYFLWRRRARRAAEQGEFLPTRSHPAFQKIMLAVVVAAFAWYLASMVSGGDPMLAVISALSMAGTFAVVAVVWGVSDLLKRKKASAATNEVVTIALCVVLTALVVVAIPVLVITAKRGGTSPKLSQDELPLSLADLLGLPEGGQCHQNRMVTQSPLLAVLEVNQYFRPDGDRARDSHWMDYTVTVVKAPFLYDLCRDSLLHQYDAHYRHYAPVDAVPWGAWEAYQSAYEDSGPMEDYLLFYPDRVVEVYFDWPPTPAQMAVVAEKLGGV